MIRVTLTSQTLELLEPSGVKILAIPAVHPGIWRLRWCAARITASR